MDLLNIIEKNKSIIDDIFFPFEELRERLRILHVHSLKTEELLVQIIDAD